MVMQIFIPTFFSKLKKVKKTRRHKQVHWMLGSFHFPQTTLNVRNKLSEECEQASSVNMFKNILYKYLIKAGYTYMYNKGKLHL